MRQLSGYLKSSSPSPCIQKHLEKNKTQLSTKHTHFKQHFNPIGNSLEGGNTCVVWKNTSSSFDSLSLLITKAQRIGIKESQQWALTKISASIHILKFILFMYKLSFLYDFHIQVSQFSFFFQVFDKLLVKYYLTNGQKFCLF